MKLCPKYLLDAHSVLGVDCNRRHCNSPMASGKDPTLPMDGVTPLPCSFASNNATAATESPLIQSNSNRQSNITDPAAEENHPSSPSSPQNKRNLFSSTNNSSSILKDSTSSINNNARNKSNRIRNLLMIDPTL